MIKEGLRSREGSEARLGHSLAGLGSLRIAVVIVAVRVALGLIVSRIALTVIRVPAIAPPNGYGRSSVVGSFLRWDALLYRDVAVRGYERNIPARSSFYPLYPGITRVLSRGAGISYGAAALAVSWLALLAATWGVVALSESLWPEARGGRAGMLLAWSPASVFLIAGYAESLLAALMAWTLVALVRQRPLIAAALAAAASAARPEGSLLGLALFVWCLQRRAYIRAVVLATVAEAGTVLYSIFLWIRYGSPIEEIHAQALWHRHGTWPFHPVLWSVHAILAGRPVATSGLESNTVAVFLLDDAVVLSAFAVTYWLIRAARADGRIWPLVTVTLLDVVLVASNGPSGVSPEGAARVLMCAVPLYLIAPRLRSENAWVTVLTASTVLALTYQVIFNLGYWFT